MKYTGWELHNFDQANLYRSYQYSLIKDDLKGNILDLQLAIQLDIDWIAVSFIRNVEDCKPILNAHDPQCDTAAQV